MTKKWNILVVAMLLGVRGVVANSGSGVAVKQAGQALNPLVAQIVKGSGSGNAPNLLRQAGMRLNEQSVDVSETLKKITQQNLGDQFSYIEQAEIYVADLKTELARTNSIEEKERVQKKLVEAQEALTKAIEAKEKATSIEVVDSSLLSTDSDVVKSETINYFAFVESKVQEFAASAKSFVTNRMPVMPSVLSVQDVKNFFKKGTNVVGGETLIERVGKLKKGLDKAKEMIARLNGEYARAESGSQKAEDISKRLNQAKEIVAKLEGKYANAQAGIGANAQEKSYSQKAKEFFGIHKNKFTVLGGASAVATFGAGLYKWFQENTDQVLENSLNVFDDVSNSEDVSNKTIWFTKKNAAIATGVTVGLAALYKLWLIFSKPSFEQLIIMYLDEAIEQDAQVIVEQFCTALQTYGYTSKEDQEKAIAVLLERGFIEA